jgi:hypothetical protein
MTMSAVDWRVLSAIVAALAFSGLGCGNFHFVHEKPSVTTGLAEDRGERVAALVDDLKAKGYSEDRAKEVASREVPFVETTYSEPLWSILTGAAQKEKAEKEKFQKDLVKAAKGPE